MSESREYLEVHYDTEKRPITNYPARLAKELFRKHDLKINGKLLEVGVGRPDVAIGFKNLGFQVSGCDLSKTSAMQCKQAGIKFKYVDLFKEKLPYPSNFFDVVYSKSVIEHMIDPLIFISECFRVLKPGGKIIVLTPDWEANYKIFFDDFTHVRPMSRRSMNFILSMQDSKDICVYRFRQLPMTWRIPLLKGLSALVSPFVPVTTKIKFLRWSRELMLAGVATKGKTNQF
jgi:SAM-dependent methyltransferase